MTLKCCHTAEDKSLKKLCLIGNPISESLSPLIHQLFIQNTKQKLQYFLKPTDNQDLSQTLKKLTQDEFSGFNVTTPLKEDIIPFLDWIDETASICNSVNTVKITDSPPKLLGFNTDCPGFMASIIHLGIIPYSWPVLVIGAGPAARSVILALTRLGAKVTVTNRTWKNLMLTKKGLEKRGIKGVEYIHKDKLKSIVEVFSLIVNAASTNMDASSKNESDFDLELVEMVKNLAVQPGFNGFIDLGYNKSLPLVNAINQITKSKSKIKIVDGKHMLFYQAICSYFIFTNRYPQTVYHDFITKADQICRNLK